MSERQGEGDGNKCCAKGANDNFFGGKCSTRHVKYCRVNDDDEEEEEQTTMMTMMMT